MQHEVTKHSLAGGAELHIINVPNSISFYFGSYIRNGHRFCDPTKYEVPHLLEHLAFEGNKTYAEPLQFKSAIEKLGAGYNAYTGTDMTWYLFVAGPEHLASIINIAMDQVFEPLFQDKRVNQQKQVITQELTRSIDDDKKNNGYLHRHKLLPTINLPFADRVKILQEISTEDVRQYHQDTYGTANTFYVLSGTFDPSQKSLVIESLNKRLKMYPKGSANTLTPLKFGNAINSVVTFDSHIPTQNHFYLSFNKIGVNLDIIQDLQILIAIYGIGLGSRMHIKAREAGLTYGFHANLGVNFDRSSINMHDQTSPDKVRPLLCLALAELVDVAQGNFTDEEFERAKGIMIGTLKRGLQTPAALAGWYDGQLLYGWPLESPQQRLQSFEKVTRESIKKAAEQYIKKDNWLLTMIGQNLEDKKKEYTDIINSYFA